MVNTRAGIYGVDVDSGYAVSGKVGSSLNAKVGVLCSSDDPEVVLNRSFGKGWYLTLDTTLSDAYDARQKAAICLKFAGKGYYACETLLSDVSILRVLETRLDNYMIRINDGCVGSLPEERVKVLYQDLCLACKVVGLQSESIQHLLAYQFGYFIRKGKVLLINNQIKQLEEKLNKLKSFLTKAKSERNEAIAQTGIDGILVIVGIVLPQTIAVGILLGGVSTIADELLGPDTDDTITAYSRFNHTMDTGVSAISNLKEPSVLGRAGKVTGQLFTATGFVLDANEIDVAVDRISGLEAQLVEVNSEYVELRNSLIGSQTDFDKLVSLFPRVVEQSATKLDEATATRKVLMNYL